MAEGLFQTALQFHQVGIVVPDLDLALCELTSLLGIATESWSIVDKSSDGFRYAEGDGETAVRARYARATVGATSYQLIAVEDGDSVWHRARSTASPIFAVGYFVDDVNARLARLVEDGAERIAWGDVTEGGRSFEYAFVRLPVSGLVVELIGPTPRKGDGERQ